MAAFRLATVIAALIVVAVVYEWSILDKVIIALIGLLIVAWLWTRDSLNRIGFERALDSDRLRVGETIHEQLTLRNHSRLPRLWLEIHDHSTLPEHHAGRVTGIRAKGNVTWTTNTEARRRGAYRLGPLTLVASDPFGLFQRSRLLPVSHEVVVYPPALDVSQVAFPSASMSGGPIHNRNLLATSPNIAGIREYSSGDPLNRISWSATARRGMMMVKEFDPDPTSDLWIILDLSERGQFDLDPPVDLRSPEAQVARFLDTTVEYIIAIGGSLAERGLLEGRKVGMVVNRSMPIRLDADDTQRQWFRIFEVLASATSFGSRSLTEALSAEGRRFNRTTGVIVVTSDPEPDWVDSARALVERHVPVSAVVVDTGSPGKDDVTPLIESLAAARVHVTRFPAHTATLPGPLMHPAVPATTYARI